MLQKEIHELFFVFYEKLFKFRTRIQSAFIVDDIYYVYIITNRYNTVLYTGYTVDIYDRTYEHKEKFNRGFSNKYNCFKLVYFEEFDNKDDAIHREKQLKRYKRQWKLEMINSMNPTWRDLIEDFNIL
jgi:putative endonuclease